MTRLLAGLLGFNIFLTPIQMEVKEKPKELVVEMEVIEHELEQWEIDELARIVYHEAGNQGYEGQRLVVSVILNRKDSDKFPNTLQGVISQKGQFATYKLHKYQPTDETYKAIEDELRDRTHTDLYFFRTGHYHAAGHPAFKHGDHYFSTL